MADGSYIIDTKIQTSGLDQDLKDVSKQFDKMSDAAEASKKTIERAFEKVGDTAQDTGREIENSLGDALDDVGDQAKATGKEIEDGVGGSFKNLFSANLFSNIAVEALEKIGEVALQVAADSIEAAADIKAANAQFAQTFKGVEGTARESLNAIAEETGITASRMQESYTKIYAFSKSVGAETSDALDISSRAMKAAADSAAYYDRSIEETTESLQSFLKGEYQNDAALGIAATETARNTKANELYATSFDRLTEAQKVDVLLAMVEAGNEASGALGQAAREADSWTNVMGELREAWRQVLGVIGDPIIEGLTPIIQGITEALKALVDTATNSTVEDEIAAVELAAQSTAATVQQLRLEYDEAKEAARLSIDSQIGLFDELASQSDTSAAQIISNWESQQKAFANYADNLQKAINMGLDEALVQQLSDGSTQSMSILDALVNDTDISIDDINAAFQGVSESRDTVSSVMADVQTDMSARLDELSEAVSSEWGDMADTVGAEITAMQSYINSLQGSTVYVDVVTRYIDSGASYPRTTYSGATGYSAEPTTAYALPANVPYLATGAVIPPNAPFYAVLGDQKHGRNIEAPESAIYEQTHKAVADVMAQYGGGDITINFTGDLAQLAKILYPEIHRQDRDTARVRGW